MDAIQNARNDPEKRGGKRQRVSNHQSSHNKQQP
jgi:hypothetical protein